MWSTFISRKKHFSGRPSRFRRLWSVPCLKNWRAQLFRQQKGWRGERGSGWRKFHWHGTDLYCHPLFESTAGNVKIIRSFDKSSFVPRNGLLLLSGPIGGTSKDLWAEIEAQALSFWCQQDASIEIEQDGDEKQNSNWLIIFSHRYFDWSESRNAIYRYINSFFLPWVGTWADEFERQTGDFQKFVKK